MRVRSTTVAHVTCVCRVSSRRINELHYISVDTTPRVQKTLGLYGPKSFSKVPKKRLSRFFGTLVASSPVVCLVVEPAEQEEAVHVG